MRSITVKSVELHPVALPLVERLRTSFGEEPFKVALLAALHTDEGIIGWGECSAEINPGYSYETLGTALHIANEFLVPALLGKTISDATEVPDLLSSVRGHPLAKHMLEAAVWDALAKANGVSLAQAFAAHLPTGHESRGYANVGVSIGIQPTVEATLKIIQKRLGEGYRRIKLKIQPGWDVELARGVRAVLPDILLMLDANSAYTLEDAAHLQQLDEFNLLMLEQPLGYNDIYEHSKLQPQLKSAICLDESIHSVNDAKLALDLGACRIINLKPARVSGYSESLEIYKLCVERNVPLWIGGLLETGVGRAANLAFASLPCVTLPCDISATSRYYDPDITEPPFVLGENSTIAVPTTPGIGVEVQMARVEEAAKRWQDEYPYKANSSTSHSKSAGNSRSQPDTRAAVLAAYIQVHPTFAMVDVDDSSYGHMGAVIADAALQAGVNYEHVVEPRVRWLVNEHPEARTTQVFLQLLETHGAENLLRFQGKKSQLVLELAQFYDSENVQTEDDLRQWLQEGTNISRLKQIKGVGDKTADYLGLLVGMETTAIDRHILNFLGEAGIEVSGYADAQEVIRQTAEILAIDTSALDRSIWHYMSNR